jgi:uncharacterized protein with PIN domain
MPAAPVLDSFALLALLRDEPGGEAVAQFLERASQRDQSLQMTEVNYAEVQYIIRPSPPPSPKIKNPSWSPATPSLKSWKAKSKFIGSNPKSEIEMAGMRQAVGADRPFLFRILGLTLL